MFGYYTYKEILKIGFGSVGQNVMISKAAELANVSKIFIGNNSRIDTFTIIAPSGKAEIRIGDNVHICAYTILNGLESIILEDFSSIGLHCNILSSTDNFDGESLTNATIDKRYLNTFSSPIFIRKHAIIATGATILPGVTISEGTVIGAYSLVKESTEPFSIVGGVPAKKIKNRSKNLLHMESKYLNETRMKKIHRKD